MFWEKKLLKEKYVETKKLIRKTTISSLNVKKKNYWINI